MSTISGILKMNNSVKIDENLLLKMLDTSKIYCPDQTVTAHNTSNEIFLGSSLIHTTPNSSDQNMKYTIFNREFLIAYDGRLNDRDELAKRLNISLDKISDTYLILRSYLKWGENFLAEIDGDFAFSIWDEQNKTLILARDRLGLKSLFYSLKNNLMIWGSEIKQLVQSPSIGIKNLNQIFLLKYLIDEPYSTEETAYSDVTRVEPAQCLIVKNGHIRSYHYYTYEPNQIKFKSESDYTEMFYDLYKNAVKSTLNTNQPMGVALSGGLDSTSIVSLGYHMNQSVDFRTYSYTFEESDGGNEDSYIHSLLKMYPVKSTFLNADNLWYFKGDFSKIIGELDEPYPHFNDAFMGEIPNKLKEQGVKILVAGIYGDHVLAGNPYNQALLLKNLKLFTLAQEYRGWIRSGRNFKKMLWEWSLKPLWNNKTPILPPWLNDEIKNIKTYKEVINDTSLKNNYWDHAGKQRYVKKLMRGLGSEWINDFFKSKGVEVRLPFLNYKLIEFMAGIPENLKMRPGVTKYMLRQSLEGIMPEKIRTRIGKSNHEYLLQKGFKKEWEQINKYSDFRILKELGYINADYNYKNHFDKYYSGLTVENNNNLPGLMRALSLEIWLRSKLLDER